MKAAESESKPMKPSHKLKYEKKAKHFLGSKWIKAHLKKKAAEKAAAAATEAAKASAAGAAACGAAASAAANAGR